MKKYEESLTDFKKLLEIYPRDAWCKRSDNYHGNLRNVFNVKKLSLFLFKINSLYNNLHSFEL